LAWRWNQSVIRSGVQRSSVRPGEHQVVVVADLGERALLSLASAVVAQRLQRRRVEREGAPAAGRLGVGLVHLVVHDHPGQARRKPGAGEVDVTPAPAGELGAAHPGGGN
jgi:hypothetical protein